MHLRCWTSTAACYLVVDYFHSRDILGIHYIHSLNLVLVFWDTELRKCHYQKNDASPVLTPTMTAHFIYEEFRSNGGGIWDQSRGGKYSTLKVSAGLLWRMPLLLSLLATRLINAFTSLLLCTSYCIGTMDSTRQFAP